MMVEQFMAELAFLIGSNENEGSIKPGEGDASTDDILSNDRRGGWGNLWD